jgi:hypothetical protein
VAETASEFRIRRTPLNFWYRLALVGPPGVVLAIGGLLFPRRWSQGLLEASFIARNPLATALVAAVLGGLTFGLIAVFATYMLLQQARVQMKVSGGVLSYTPLVGRRLRIPLGAIKRALFLTVDYGNSTVCQEILIVGERDAMLARLWADNWQAADLDRLWRQCGVTPEVRDLPIRAEEVSYEFPRAG